MGAAGTDCSPFGTGNPINTAGAPAGTVFVGTSAQDGSVISPLWNGDVATTRPPTVTGPIRANALVTPIDGGWSGGWDGDRHVTQLSACPTADGTDCTSLTDLNYVGGGPSPLDPLTPACSNGAAVIDPVFTGWYLRVADGEVGPGTVFLTGAYWSPYGHPIWVADAIQSVALVGRIAPATGPRTARCGPPPLPPRANPRAPGWCMPGQTPPHCFAATLSRDGLAEVWCMFSTCNVTIRVERGTRSARYVTRVWGVEQVSLPRRLTRRLGPGRALITITIFGRRLAARRVTFA